MVVVVSISKDYQQKIILFNRELVCFADILIKGQKVYFYILKMCKPFKSDINKTLENIYLTEQRPFEISVLFFTTNHAHFMNILITKDTDYKDFRIKVLHTVQNFIEQFGLNVMSRLYFKVYRLT